MASATGLHCAIAQVYKHMGRVVGQFYTADGNRTAELERVEAAAAEYSNGQQPDRPSGSPCNVQWSASAGEHARSKPADAQTSALHMCCHEVPSLMKCHRSCARSVWQSLPCNVRQSVSDAVSTPILSPRSSQNTGSPCPRRDDTPGNPAGKEVWCSQGKGFPRRVAAPTGDAAAVERCECSEQPVYSDAARLYDGCPQTATRCRVAGAAA